MLKHVKIQRNLQIQLRSSKIQGSLKISLKKEVLTPDHIQTTGLWILISNLWEHFDWLLKNFHF